jgi:hypothetical protein
MLLAVPGLPVVLAQEPALSVELSSYVVEDTSGTVVTGERLLAGDTYTVAFEVKVSADLPDTKLALTTSLEKARDVFWSLENDDEYTGVDTESWQPGQSSIEFDAVKGTAQFTLEGTVPLTYTTEELTDGESSVTLHKVKSIPVLRLSLGTEGEVLNERSSEVVDQTILAYQQTLSEKNSLLQVASADATYSELAQDIVATAENLNSQGFVVTALALLDTLPASPSGFPSVEEFEQERAAKQSLLQATDSEPKYKQLVSAVIGVASDLSDAGFAEGAMDLLDILPNNALDFPEPVSEGSSLVYLIVIVILVIGLIAFLALLLRARSNVSFVRQQVEEEMGRLDVLLVRITKVDKQLARDVEQVKEQLERISGR